MDLATVDHLLTTTRAVRKRLDLERPVEPEVLERCIEIALQAPSGSNRQGWHFVVVTDPAKRRAVADLYRRSFRAYAASNRTQPPPETAANDPRIAQAPRVRASATYLSEHMHEVPVLVIPCIEGRAEQAGVSAQASLYGSILPATWSLMLELRARGLLDTRQRDAGALIPVAYSCSPSGRAVSGRHGRRSTSSTSTRRQQSWTYPTT